MHTTQHSRRPGAVMALAATVIGAVLGLAGCGGGTGNGEAHASQVATNREPRPSRSHSAQPTRSPEAERTTARPPTSPADRPEQTRTTAPAGNPPATRGEPTRPDTPAATTTRPPTTAAAAPPAPTTHPGTTAATVATTASTVAVVATASGMGPLGWFTLLALVAALAVGGLLLYRSQRKSAWDTEARALDSETRTVTGAPLSSLLITGRTEQRRLAWPSLRADLTGLVGRWNALAERASGDERRIWSAEIGARLQDLVAAVDAEDEAMAVGADWTALRPRVRQAQQSLATVLAGRSPTEPPPAGEPGPTAFQS